MRVIRSCYKWVAFRIERCTVETNADSCPLLELAEPPSNDFAISAIERRWPVKRRPDTVCGATCT